MRTLIAIFLAILSAHAVIAETYDVRYGTFEAPDDFAFKHTGTIDSFMGTLTRKSDGFVISFDIGYMAGVHMSQAKKEECVFYRAHKINDNIAFTGIERTNRAQIITTTIYDQLGKEKRAPANFWADIKHDSDIAEFLLIVSTYKPKAP
jgi:hypothetical protein